MTKTTELWINRQDFYQTKTVTKDLAPLAEGEVLVAIDRFALTANNVSYAVSGDFIGYWGYYPAEGNWGKVPVWACGDVIESRCDEVTVGERLWGFFPMASHVALQPGKVTTEQFFDVAEHRRELPSLYNAFRRTQAEPEFIQAMDTERCLLFPLFITSYVIYDYLIDNDFFGAQQVVIGSASSKTGFGLAKLLHQDTSFSVDVIGLTSERNVDFLKQLNCCDTIITYDNESTLNANLPTAYVDMSGDIKLTQALHNHFGSNLVDSAMVGASHWEAGGDAGKLPGAKPTFFFAPAQIGKRDKEWGAGAMMNKASVEVAALAKQIESDMTIDWAYDTTALANLWNDLLDNKIPPSRGLMISLSKSGT